MARELYVRRRWCSRDFFALFIVNALLVAVAALMVRFRQSLVHSKWIEIARGAFERYADTFATGMLVVASVLFALVVFGSIVTLLRVKKLLIVYAMALTLTLIAMAFLVVSAFQVSGQAAQWRDDKQYGSSSAVESSSKEAQIEKHFNGIYCDAQQAFFCDHATLKELLALGISNLTGSDNNSSSSKTSASGICARAQDSNASSSSSGWSQLCSYCAGSKSYKEFKAVVSWTQSNCDFSTATVEWCSSSSNTSSSVEMTSAAAAGSPYSSCRATLLQETVAWSRGFGIAWSATCFLLLLLLASVALLLHTHEHANALDLDDVETPSHSESAVYEKA
ncbi:hypothetical protein Gpo141_00003636 [Globisporangium polare]